MIMRLKGGLTVTAFNFNKLENEKMLGFSKKAPKYRGTGNPNDYSLPTSNITVTKYSSVGNASQRFNNAKIP
jgi:hypothetical protein